MPDRVTIAMKLRALGYDSHGNDIDETLHRVLDELSELRALKEAIITGNGTFILGNGDLYDLGWQRQEETKAVETSLTEALKERDRFAFEARRLQSQVDSLKQHLSARMKKEQT